MALKTFQCECGNVFADLVGSQFADSGRRPCPKCGSAVATEMVAAGRYVQGYDYRNADPVEKQWALENNKIYTDQAEKILSGEVTIREPKGLPRELRLQVPEHLQKRYY